MTNEVQLSNYSNQTFLALDKWLTQVGKLKGDNALEIVKDAFQNNIRANITYYETLAVEAEKRNQTEIAVQNRRIAKLYNSLSV